MMTKYVKIAKDSLKRKRILTGHAKSIPLNIQGKFDGVVVEKETMHLGVRFVCMNLKKVMKRF